MQLQIILEKLLIFQAMMLKHITYKNSKVSYYKYGTGKEVMVAFHGFNQDGQAYQYFEDVLAQRFTVIAIDFFWHGKSEWNEEEDFTDADMCNIFWQIAYKEGLKQQRFSVCSFSMGARMARALVKNYAHLVDYFILLSPPTFAFNSFLNFTTNHPIGLAAFKYFLNTPGALQRWVSGLHRVGILNRSVYVFTSKFVGTPDRLLRVYNTWHAQRKLQTNFKYFATLVNKHHIKVILVVGKNDFITPPMPMIKYVRKLTNSKVFILRKKHELATPQTKQLFNQLFN